MPAHDIFHDHVKNALIKDGWTITDDPMTIRWGIKKMYIDLAAEKLLAAEKGERKIAVEIKSFIGKSDVLDLEQAIGQFILYEDVLEEIEPDRVLYLAIEETAFNVVFAKSIGQVPLRKKRLRLVVFAAESEEIMQWVP